MSSLHRDLTGSGQVHRLKAESDAVGAEIAHPTGRSARTLVKEGALRVTLVTLAPGANLAPHHANGPVTIQVIEGTLELWVREHPHSMRAGDLLALAAGIEHSACTDQGATLLVTVAQTA